MNKFLSAFAMILLFMSCSKTKETESPTLGKYVFEDDNAIIHIDENCYKLRHGHDDNGHEIYAKHPIDTTEIVSIGRLCSRCVSIDNYEHIKTIAKRNELRYESRKWLYDKFIWANYDMGDYNIFIHDIANEQKRRRLYLAAQREGWDVGSSFDEFSTLLGF